MDTSINRQQLHMLVDMIDESGIKTLYDVMLRFIPEDEPTADEIEGILAGRAEYERGEFVRFEDIE